MTYVNVYTDGCCLDNGRDNARAGIGVVWPHGEAPDVCMKLFPEDHPNGKLTNNYSEIKAATEALKQADERGIFCLRIRTDSQFLIRCMKEYVPKWQSNGWRTVSGEGALNETELKELVAWRDRGISVMWQYVPAHSGNSANERADWLARQAAKAKCNVDCRYLTVE